MSSYGRSQAAPRRFDIAFLVADEEENGMWMAFRREENNVTNWCYQEYFKLPDLKGEHNFLVFW